MVAPEMVSTLTWPARGADRDALVRRLADILVGKSAQLFIGDADGEDRLLVMDDAHADDAPAGVEADEGVDRLAGVGRNADNVVSLEYITEQLAAAPHRGRRRLALERPEAVGRGEKIARHRIALGNILRAEHGRVHRRDQHQTEQQQARQGWRFDGHVDFRSPEQRVGSVRQVNDSLDSGL